MASPNGLFQPPDRPLNRTLTGAHSYSYTEAKMCFENKVVLVTGGNFGIGRSIVLQMVEDGASAVIVARNKQRGLHVESEVKQRGGRAAFFQADVSDEKAVIDVMDNTIETFGRLDIVVNNAGCGSQHCGITRDVSPGKRWSVFRGSNLDATYYVSAHALPHLAKNRNSAIVNISSTATCHGNWGLYGAAKTGVEGLTRSFAAEAAPYGIRVNCISPGWIATSEEEAKAASGSDNGEWALPPSLLNRMGTPGEIARTVRFLASEDASFVTGQTLVVDGGLSITDYPSLPTLAQVGHRLYSRSH